MKNKIEILSPGPGCIRTQRIINEIKSILEKKQVEFELEVISDKESFSNYRTWILPTVIINSKVVSRGYIPSEQKIFENIFI